ncbi:nitrate ABC transporter ATP-binding protein [Sodalis-like symbiont of Philaenus spumarius]|nr:nitrate ABC transporter ATP-binding protein [Sodalis-like symbiont of Philaenus spumarius]
MSAVKLALRQVSHRFDALTALAPTDLEVQQGEFICLVGPSGCGKSTLFNVISGVLVPDSGQVLIDGRDVTGSSCHVGYMLQKDLLLPWKTVIDNIVLGATVNGGASRAQRAQGVALARRYGLGEFLNHYPAALSGGMCQRVALMRTLAMEHDIMLLDEPFGSLDAQTRLAMQQWLLQVWSEQRRTVVFITHDIDEAIMLADRVVVMTPRPGSIGAQLPVPVPRPRSVVTLTDPRFIALKGKILSMIYHDATTESATHEKPA